VNSRIFRPARCRNSAAGPIRIAGKPAEPWVVWRLTAMSVGVITGPSERAIHSPPEVPMTSCAPEDSHWMTSTRSAAMVKSSASSSSTVFVEPSRLSGRMISRSADCDIQNVCGWFAVLA
jgi:hypothetical protein